MSEADQFGGSLAGRGPLATQTLEPVTWTQMAGREDFLASIRSAIASGALGVGAQLPNERQLAASTGLSRATVRAALDRLVHEGRLVRQVGRGTFVVDTGLADRKWDDACDLAPAKIIAGRALIEPTLPPIIVMNASDAELRSIARFVEDGFSVSTWQQAEFFDSRFHFLLFEATGNDLLRQIGLLISRTRTGQAWMQVKRRQHDQQRWAEYQLEHKCIVRALVDRDPAEATRLLRVHLAGVGAVLK